MRRIIPRVIRTQVRNKGVRISQGAKIKAPGIVHKKGEQKVFFKVSMKLKVVAANKAEATVLKNLQRLEATTSNAEPRRRCIRQGRARILAVNMELGRNRKSRRKEKRGNMGEFGKKCASASLNMASPSQTAIKRNTKVRHVWRIFDWNAGDGKPRQCIKITTLSENDSLDLLSTNRKPPFRRPRENSIKMTLNPPVEIGEMFS